MKITLVALLLGVLSSVAYAEEKCFTINPMEEKIFGFSKLCVSPSPEKGDENIFLFNLYYSVVVWFRNYGDRGGPITLHFTAETGVKPQAGEKNVSAQK